MLVVRRVAPRISVIVVNYRATELLLRCLDHVVAALAAVDGGGEVLVIDNAATGETARALAGRPVTLVEERENTGFAPAVARGTPETTAPWIALVNNDADVAPDCFERLLAAGESAPDVGSVAAQIRFTEPPGVLNSAGWRSTASAWPGNDWRARRSRRATARRATCSARRAASPSTGARC